WFCAGLLFRAFSYALASAELSGTNILANPTNPIYLRATGGRHGETTLSFACSSAKERVISQCLLLILYVKNSFSGTRPVQGQVQACLAQWILRTPGAGNLARFRAHRSAYY